MKEQDVEMAKSGSFSQPFNMGYVPPKEGRVPPANVRLRQRRRTAVILIVAIVVAICLVLKYVQTTAETIPEIKLGSRLRDKYGPSVKIEKDTAPLPASEPESIASSSVAIVETSTQPVASIPTKKSTSNPGSKQETITIAPKDDDDFDQLFEDVINLLPSEMQQRALLAPITTSGAERMHELALRTREFKKLFDAWEDLHLVFHEKQVVIQDDVISYLRKREKNFHAVKGTSRRTAVEEDKLDLAQTIRDYMNFRWLLQQLGDVLFPWIRPYFGDHMALHAQLYAGGRGIVFTAGTDQAPFVMTSIGVLRELGCDLPVEVMYLGEGDLDVDAREKLEDMPGVITRDIRLMVKDEGWALAGWAGKPFAILFSSFREVIFIDADSLFLQNPAILFDDPGYKDTGALFFYDRLMKGDGKRHWMETVLPKPVSKKARKSRMWGSSDHMQESGVVVVDTFRHMIPLLVVSRNNGPDRDGNADKGITGVYDMLFGDKETFWLSWEMVGSSSYAFHSGPAGVIGNFAPGFQNATHTTSEIDTDGVMRTVHTYEEDTQICAPQLLHVSRDGSPLWFNGWILANKFEKERSPIAQLELFMREPENYREPESWTIGESNSCCLRNSEVYEFTEKEKKTIQTILKVAFRVGAVGKKGGTPKFSGENLYG